MTESSSRRSFVPDAELLERIAVGEESLRSLGRELGVAHTTLGRWRRRPEVASELRAAQQRRRARHAKERRAEKDLRRRARQQAARDREFGARHGTPEDRVSRNDELAAQTVAAGGGVQELIEATGFRTRLGVYESVDPQIVEQSLANDDRRLSRDWMAAGTFRRLVPDPALIYRRAAGESLRRLAEDYKVSPSTLSRFFARPEVAEELRLRRREMEEQRTNEPEPDHSHVALADHLAAKISDVWCPRHRRRTYVRNVDRSSSEIRLEVAGCCDEAIQELVRWLKIYRAVLPTGTVFTPSGHAPANATVPPA